MFHAGFGGDAKRTLAALGRSMAIIEFEPDGKIITANENFCRALGYDLEEIKGKHHSMFVEPDYARSVEYREFWAKLGRGEFDAREYKRIGKGGKEVWIQASYSPVLSASGKVVKVVKAASDVTAAKMQNAENSGKLDAISRAQAVIEFTIDGKILTANENFLNVLGYRLDEVQGQHHRMFVEPAYAQSAEYQEFWRKLDRSEFVADEFKRIGKGGKEIWIQASYNPIFDLNKRVVKVVKFATDVTGRVNAVNAIATGLSRLAEGDLKKRIDVDFIPSLDRLRVDFNASIEALEHSMVAITGSTQAIRTGIGEISTAADDLSRRSEQQASSLEETAAALEEITVTVKKTADGAQHARDVVSAAKVDADKSGVVVREATAAMSGIEKSSNQISQIIGVIDEIAFQTNLLALNAGVEAARAGDAGRGFAVVASEVRALAQRSAEAAKEIKGLISASTAQVEQGVALVTQTGNALERIVAQVVEINNIISDIASSAQQQAAGLQQVNTAVNEMDKVTQQNAAMVEETTAACHSLVAETEELTQMVGRYQTRQVADDPLRAQLKKAVPHAFREAPKKVSSTEASASSRAKPEPRATIGAKSRRQRLGIAGGRCRLRRKLAGLLRRARRIGPAPFAAPLSLP